MENQDCFPAGVAAYGRLKLLQAGPKEEIFYVGCLVEVHSSPDMSAVELVVESTINDMIVGLLAVMTIEEFIQLDSQVSLEKKSMSKCYSLSQG